MKKYLLEADNMTEKIKNWVNICVLKNQEILLLNRQHDNFPGWIPPRGEKLNSLKVFLKLHYGNLRKRLDSLH